MTPAEAKDWMLPIGLAVTVLFGAAMLVVSVRASWITKAVAWTSIIYAVLGAGLTLSPKWEKFSAKANAEGFEVQITKLQDDLRKAQEQNDILSREIALVSKLNSSDFASAGDVKRAIDTVATNVEWARFLPTDPKSYKVEVTPTDMSAYVNLADALGKTPQEVEAAVKGTGLTVLQTVPSAELSKVPADELWVSPTGQGKSR